MEDASPQSLPTRSDSESRRAATKQSNHPASIPRALPIATSRERSSTDLTRDSVMPKGARRHPDSTDNAEVGGSIPPSPTKKACSAAMFAITDALAILRCTTRAPQGLSWAVCEFGSCLTLWGRGSGVLGDGGSGTCFTSVVSLSSGIRGGRTGYRGGSTPMGLTTAGAVAGEPPEGRR
jgi:hypothetical protein